jgi:predicted ATPase
VGDTTTLAAALTRQARPGSILASAATLRLVRGEVRTAAAPPLRVDEHCPPLQVAEILYYVPWQMSLSVSAAYPRSPFVGREAELRVLQARLAWAEQGQGQVVGIVGEPGIGKSRLLDEFRQAVRMRQVTYLHGCCQSYGHTMPYLPLRGVLQATWGISEADSSAAITHKVCQGLERIACAADVWTPYFLPLLGVQASTGLVAEESPERWRERTFEALHQFCGHSSQQQPLILALENLHWSDATSEAYLSTLVERLAGMPILLLLTFRPGYRPGWLSKSYATQIALQPLGADDSRKIVRASLRHTPATDALERQIMARAEGNPFFLEELARTVVEQEPHSTLVVPETIQAVIATRIDRLPPEEKWLLQTATVIGKEVPLPLLRVLVGMPEATLATGLRHLQAAEFLYETSLAPEPVYAFKHVLTHEVAYSSLLQEQRRALQARVVEVLETLADDTPAERVEQLARHALRASGSSALPANCHK